MKITPHIIGISGMSGAGKSTLARVLTKTLEATLIGWDEFDDISSGPNDYVDWSNRGKDYAEFHREHHANVLKTLKAGQQILHPLFPTLLNPTKYIIFDAPLGRFHHQTGQFIDTWAHIHLPLDVLLCRRTLRDFKDSSRSKEDLLEDLQYYLDYSRPLFMDDAYIHEADLIIDGLLTTTQQQMLILEHLK